MKRKRKSLTKDQAKAVRAASLYDRGHSLESIAEMCSIPSGSVTKRIEMGRRCMTL